MLPPTLMKMVVFEDLQWYCPVIQLVHSFIDKQPGTLPIEETDIFPAIFFHSVDVNVMVFIVEISSILDSN